MISESIIISVTMKSFTFLMPYRCQHFSGFTAPCCSWRLTVFHLLGSQPL